MSLINEENEEIKKYCVHLLTLYTKPSGQVWSQVNALYTTRNTMQARKAKASMMRMVTCVWKKRHKFITYALLAILEVFKLDTLLVAQTVDHAKVMREKQEMQCKSLCKKAFAKCINRDQMVITLYIAKIVVRIKQT